MVSRRETIVSLRETMKRHIQNLPTKPLFIRTKTLSPLRNFFLTGELALAKLAGQILPDQFFGRRVLLLVGSLVPNPKIRTLTTCIVAVQKVNKISLPTIFVAYDNQLQNLLESATEIHGYTVTSLQL